MPRVIQHCFEKVLHVTVEHSVRPLSASQLATLLLLALLLLLSLLLLLRLLLALLALQRKDNSSAISVCDSVDDTACHMRLAI